MSYSASSYPYDTVVRITDTIGGQSWQGSGVLISPDEVLTASHVVYIQGEGTANDIVVTPGYNDGSSPYGSANGTYIHYYQVNDANRTISNDVSQYDYAVIHLATPFTNAGYMGLQSNFDGGSVNITGYPGSANGAQVDSTQTVTLDPNYTLLDGTALGEGSSGGPVWTDVGGEPRVVGVVSSESNTSSTGYNAQITTAAFNQIEAWVAADDAPVAAPALVAIVLSPPDGVVDIGALVTITLTFTAAVTVTGTPTLTLNDGANANYVAGSGSTSLTFVDDVAATDTAVAALAVTGVSLAGGTLSGSGGAATTSLAGISQSGPQVVTIPVPFAPTGFDASGTGSDATTLSWQAASIAGGGTIDGYVVIENGASLETVTGTTVTVGNLAPSTTYSFAVAAVDAAGTSPATSAISVTTSAPAPSTPTGLTASQISAGGATLSWLASTVAGGGTITGYVIFENGNPIATASGTSDAVSGLTPATAFSFSVAAEFAGGESVQSAPLSVTTTSLAAPTQSELPDLSSVLSASANAALLRIEAALASGGTTTNDVVVASGVTSLSAIPGKLNALTITNAVAGSAAFPPYGYRAEYLLGGGPATLSDTTGNDLLVAVTAQATLSGGSNDTLIGGDGQTTIFTGGTGNTVVGGTGANLMWLAAGTSFVDTQGADTIVGLAGTDTINAAASKGLLYFGSGPTTYEPGAAVDTVVGFKGSLTATGGANGTLFFTGTAGNNNVSTGAGSTTIIGFGADDLLTATGSGSNVIAASAATETVNGAQSTGTNTFFAFGTNDLLIGGSGRTALESGLGNHTLVAGGGSTLFEILAGVANRAITIENFSASRDFVQLQGYDTGAGAAALQTAQTSGGSEILTLTDGTILTFQGVTGLAAASFT